MEVIMHNLKGHLRLLPHEDRLLTSSAEFWFVSARSLIFVMALAEGLAWAYLGYLFGEGWVRYVVAGFTGMTIFVVIWMIDTSLLTLDLAWGEHAAAILGQKVGTDLGRRLRSYFTFSLRISLLVVSLAITAPYLAQIVFYKDIERHASSEASQALETSRNQLKARFDSLIATREEEIRAKRLEYEREVAGAGASKRFGRGPAAEAIYRTVAKLEADLDAVENERTSRLLAFDQLARDWTNHRDEIAAAYNVVLPQPSILQNRKALDALRQRPENRSTELAIKAFLSLIFGGLLLLKLFEPSSVRLYLSEVLQQEYQRYLAGTFDAVLPPSERSTSISRAMAPQRLYEFLVKIWVPARNLEAQQADAKARTAAAAQNLDFLEGLRKGVETGLAGVRTESQILSKDADERKQSLIQLESAISAVRRDVDALRGELASLDTASTLDRKSQLEYRSYVGEKLGNANRALRELEEALPSEMERCQRAESAFKEAGERLRGKVDEVAEIDRGVREIRELLAAAAGDRARSILNPASRP
jgi:hypothetical protein